MILAGSTLRQRCPDLVGIGGQHGAILHLAGMRLEGGALMARLLLGEGVEKEETDFAAEVAAAVKG